MTARTLDLEHVAEVAIAAARRAGAYIQSRLGSIEHVSQKKGGSSVAAQVVTEVDGESERLILEVLGEVQALYGLGLLTEERVDDASRYECEHFFCIDPLDGTLSFIEGKPGYAVLIAVVSQS